MQPLQTAAPAASAAASQAPATPPAPAAAPSAPASAASFADSKPHYEILDGLRGVAALAVIWYHVFEGYAFAGGGAVKGIPHGYLAVDFFFMLSGFVISYAYDDRWGRGLTVGGFFRRRLIRLHPMVVIGALLGAATFLLQGSVQWDGTAVAPGAVLLAFAAACLFIPAWPGAPYEVRGNAEMFPLNGPSWSLFFEYIGNILYALFIRRLGTRALGALVLLTGAGLAFFALADPQQYGSVGVGWSLTGVNFPGGLVRMLFPFTLGMWLARRFRPTRIRGAFWICSALLLALFFVPNITGELPVSANGLFEVACIALLFPAILWIGASGVTTDLFSTGLCRFLGDISFPVYIIHYPFMYLFYAWMIRHGIHDFAATWPWAVALLAGNLLLAWLLLRLYDEPLRRWLAGRFLRKTSR